LNTSVKISSNKIISLEGLTEKVKSAKTDGKKVVHCHGVFDLLHIGHIKHFEEAKSYGDILVVTATADKYVNKGPNRPVFAIELRLEALASLEAIDYVAENKGPTAVETIKILKPDIYCKGPDFKNNADDITGKIGEEKDAVKFVDGEIKYTTDITFSSSNLLNRFGDVYSKPQKSFIEQLKSKYSFDDMKKLIDDLKDAKVLVIGETIIDQYVFCEALGKSGKEPVLVLRDMGTEQYAGGAAAIARHLADFCSEITLLSILGEKGEHEDFIRSNIPENVETFFLYKTDSPTIVKKRFVDHINKSKVLGVYSLNEEVIKKDIEMQFLHRLEKLIPQHDMVIVSDYGHGMISSKTAEFIAEKAPFLALNAQVNAANIGYHTMNKYRSVECAIINETELRHELRDREGDVKPLLKKLAVNLSSKFSVVTSGSSGAILYNHESEDYFVCPAFASKVVDKIGAGDAMLALLSISLFNTGEESLSLLLGSLAAAQSVESIGNSIPISKTTLLKTIQHSFK
jgi:rfaE bifunctional protein kinase chain/domain/rfaE bifunctional protein nucleotidyltransferase chain/domain